MTGTTFDLKKAFDDVVELARENFNLRNIFDFAMDTYMKLLPKDLFERGMDFGKKVLDEVIYLLPFFGR
ncbi:MAG: hypothetical protein ACTSUE_08835 [Promethearchaeota archaeon]